jgi:hypothetical protein
MLRAVFPLSVATFAPVAVRMGFADVVRCRRSRAMTAIPRLSIRAEMLIDNCSVAGYTSAAHAEPHLPRDTGGRVLWNLKLGRFHFGSPNPCPLLTCAGPGKPFSGVARNSGLGSRSLHEGNRPLSPLPGETQDLPPLPSGCDRRIESHMPVCRLPWYRHQLLYPHTLYAICSPRSREKCILVCHRHSCLCESV